jgi:hypothetical protein
MRNRQKSHFEHRLYRPRRTLPLLACLLEITTFSVCLAQTHFKEQKEGYELTLPSSAWRAETRPNATYPHTEFVYGPADEIRLRIRLRFLDQADTPETLANRARDRRLQLPGFINSSIEPFAGKLSGVRVAYEYARGGRLVSQQTYYLRASNRTIYILRFSGPPDVLKRIQAQTESIARSFSPSLN